MNKPQESTRGRRSRPKEFKPRPELDPKLHERFPKPSDVRAMNFYTLRRMSVDRLKSLVERILKDGSDEDQARLRQFEQSDSNGAVGSVIASCREKLGI